MPRMPRMQADAGIDPFIKFTGQLNRGFRRGKRSPYIGHPYDRIQRIFYDLVPIRIIRGELDVRMRIKVHYFFMNSGSALVIFPDSMDWRILSAVAGKTGEMRKAMSCKSATSWVKRT